jgi:addiction module RelE/StbE family toxin
MIEIIWDEPFLRILKKWRKKYPDLQERFQQKITLFVEEPFHPSLRTHRLSGNLDGYWSLSITHEYRLVFKFVLDNQVLLIDIGSHDEVY